MYINIYIYLSYALEFLLTKIPSDIYIYKIIFKVEIFQSPHLGEIE